MDVLRPPVVWIDGRCYRKLPYEQNVNESPSALGGSASPPAPYREQEGSTYEDEVCDAFDAIEYTGREFRTSMAIPSELFKFIIGRQGETKKRIEQETKTRIFIPRMGQTGDIVITGPGKGGVLSAQRKVNVVVESSRSKVAPTHFVSFPLYFDGLAKKAEEFKDTVLKECSKDRGIDESIFQLPCKLHLTIGMLLLLAEQEVEQAAKFLSECYQDLVKECLGDEPVYVELRGVECMNDDPENVNVLYFKVIELDGSKRLQNLADSLMETFISRGLMRREYDRIKLHVTIMNGKLRTINQPAEAVPTKGRRSNERQKNSFDARNVIEMFKDFSFGQYRIDRIHVSQRGVYDEAGHYHCAGEVMLG